jgi:hypothetical protein
VYIALLPPSADGSEARTLQLCAHHARAHRSALADANIALYDADGRSVESGTTPWSVDAADPAVGTNAAVTSERFLRRSAGR